MNKKILFLLGVCIGASSMSWAAIHETSVSVENILSLPLNNRLQSLRKLDHGRYDEIRALAFNAEQNMELRWRALLALPRLQPKRAVVDLDAALKSKEWFMRSSALLGWQSLGREPARARAESALKDKALMVRATAVDILADIGDTASAPTLWSALNDRNNYMNQQSLFIRRRIVEALSAMERAGSEAKFVAILADADSTLHEPAILALERLTGRRLGQVREATQLKKGRWQKWWAAGHSPDNRKL